MNTQPPANAATDAQAHAWRLLLAVRAVVDAQPRGGSVSLHYNSSTGDVDVDQPVRAGADLRYVDDQRWIIADELSSATRALLDLYLPVLGTHKQPGRVVGHLGQSVDAKIATTQGDAFFVTGEENRKHLHRMRALCHAVLVGAETVIADNPQLTTRAVVGPDPIRVVLDPRGRVPSDNTLLSDARTDTWLVHNASVDLTMFNDPPHVQRIVMNDAQDRLHLPDVVAQLKSRGVMRLFVEGGGVTVSGMMSAHCLNRLQIAVAPVMVGDGRPALQLPAALSMQSAIRPPYKLYRMGEDVLWDFDLNGITDADNSATSQTVERLL